MPAVGDRLPAAEIEIRGLVHLQQALARGKGAILWESNGFSRRVQAKRTLHTHGIRLHQTDPSRRDVEPARRRHLAA